MYRAESIRRPESAPDTSFQGWRLPGVAEPAQVIANSGRRGESESVPERDSRGAKRGAGDPYEGEDLGADSLQMKPSASTLTFCSQSRPSAGSVQAYHVFP